VICTSCNETLGREIDADLCETVKEIRNYLALSKGDRYPAPMINRDDPVHGRVVLMPGGLPVSREITFDVKRDGNNIELNVSVGTLEKLIELVPHIAKRLNITEAQVRDVLQESTMEQTHYLSPVPHEISFGTERSQRAMAKMCLILIAARLGVDRVHTFDVRSSMAYIVSGANRAEVSIGFQTNKLPISDTLEHNFGPFFNALITRITGQGMVYGYFRLYNGLSWLFSLGKADFRCSGTYSLFNNPQAPRFRSEDDFGASMIDDIFFSQADFSNVEACGRAFVTRVMQDYWKRARGRTLEEAVDEVIQELGFHPDQALSSDEVEDILRRTSDRIIRQVMRMPISRPFRIKK
jgi:hypothetical protein